jgi:hypothetical protein
VLRQDTVWNNLLFVMSVHLLLLVHCLYKGKLNYDHSNWAIISMESVIKV